MVTPELKCPITYRTPAEAKLFATDTPCLGSAASSPMVADNFLLRMPLPALKSAMACSAPCLSCEPKAAFEPVIGPPMPNLMVSLPPPPQPASARLTPHANPSETRFFICASPEPGADRGASCHQRGRSQHSLEAPVTFCARRRQPS